VIQLNYRDAKPIYEQIKDGFKNLLVTGAIEAGEKLPSVRELASSLTINPNTIQRAYHDLEQEGYIYIQTGKGAYAADQKETVLIRKEELFQDFDSVVLGLFDLSVESEMLEERMKILGKGRKYS